MYETFHCLLAFSGNFCSLIGEFIRTYKFCLYIWNTVAHENVYRPRLKDVFTVCNPGRQGTSCRKKTFRFKRQFLAFSRSKFLHPSITLPRPEIPIKKFTFISILERCAVYCNNGRTSLSRTRLSPTSRYFSLSRAPDTPIYLRVRDSGFPLYKIGQITCQFKNSF